MLQSRDTANKVGEKMYADRQMPLKNRTNSRARLSSSCDCVLQKDEMSLCADNPPISMGRLIQDIHLIVSPKLIPRTKVEPVNHNRFSESIQGEQKLRSRYLADTSSNHIWASNN